MKHPGRFLAAYFLAMLVVAAVVFLTSCAFNDIRTGEDCPCHNWTECKPCPK